MAFNCQAALNSATANGFVVTAVLLTIKSGSYVYPAGSRVIPEESYKLLLRR
jgi:hypothetical protein